MKRIKYLLLFTLLFIASACVNQSTPPQKGTIIVTVVDGNTPVPDETITLLPDSLVKTTDENGICKFEVSPGNYFVNAQLPGPGPKGYVYHIPVEIKKGQTITIKLKACLLCV